MTSISGVSNAWASAGSQRAGRMAERIQAKFDSDSSGGIDTTELKSMLEDVAKKTGVSTDTSAADLLAKNDSNGDGSLSGKELESTLKGVLPPPPSTMDFAQSRGATGQGGDDLFSKVDSDGDGAVSQTELQGLLEKMPGGTASQTGVSADKVFSQLDANGDGGLTQAEFDAGRPSNGDVAAAGDAGEGMPPPPPGGPAGPDGAGGPPPAGAPSSSADSSTTYDPLDTNEDGVVSLTERLGAASSTQELAQALLKAADANGDNALSAGEVKTLVEQLQSAANNTGNTSSTAAQSEAGKNDKTSDEVRQDLAQLADLASRQYAAVANNLSGKTQGNTLSVMA